MAFEGCQAEIAAALGKKPEELDPKERDMIGNRVLDIVKKLEKKYSGAELTKEIQKAVADEATKEKISALYDKRNAAKNAEAKMYLADQVFHGYKNAPDQGLLSHFESSRLNRPGARSGVSHEISSLKNEYVQGMFGKLARDGVDKIAISGTMDKEVWTAMYEMGKKIPDQRVMVALPEDAVKIAKIYSEFNERARVGANDAGARIEKSQSYVLRQSHDAQKIAKAGGFGIPMGDPKHLEAWKSDMMRLLDFDKTFRDVPDEKINGILDSLHQQFSNGYHLTFGEKDSQGAFSGGGNIGKKMSHDRVLHFKDAESEFEYNKKYGQASTLAEGMYQGLTRTARDTAIMNKFGPNAESNLKAAVDDLKMRYHDSGDGAMIEPLQKQYDKLMRNFWPHLTGEANVPGNKMWAQVNSAVRSTISMSKLGGAAVNLFGHLPFMASSANYAGERTMTGFYSHLYDGITGTMRSLFQKGTPEAKQIAGMLGIQLEHSMGHMNNVFAADADVPGRISKMMELYFSLNGLTHGQDAERLGAVAAKSAAHAEMSGKNFSELVPGFRDFFLQHNIGEHEWNVLRNSEKIDGLNKEKLLIPENILNVDDSHVQNALQAQGRKTTATNVESFKKNLKTSYARLLSDFSHMATGEQSIMNRADMLGGAKPGTPTGELLRYFWQFKSFMQSVNQKYIGRELYGYHSENTSLPKAVGRLFTNPQGGLTGLANIMVAGSAMGYISSTLKDAAKGKAPRVPDTKEQAISIAAASFLHSGSAGIYGDFLLGPKSRFGKDKLTTFLGPAAGIVHDTSDIWDTLRSDDKNKGKELKTKGMDFMLNNAPVVSSAYNLIYTKAALDYMIVYRMKEMANPGYLSRMEKKLKTDQNQNYIVPPSSVIPRGGG